MWLVNNDNTLGGIPALIAVGEDHIEQMEEANSLQEYLHAESKLLMILDFMRMLAPAYDIRRIIAR